MMRRPVPPAERLRLTPPQRGAALLDDRGLAGWRQLIDLDRFSMASCRLDVLGQLYGSYAEGARKLGLTRVTAAGYGFIWPIGAVANDTLIRALTAEWLGIIGGPR